MQILIMRNLEAIVQQEEEEDRGRRFIHFSIFKDLCWLYIV